MTEFDLDHHVLTRHPLPGPTGELLTAYWCPACEAYRQPVYMAPDGVSTTALRDRAAEAVRALVGNLRGPREDRERRAVDMWDTAVVVLDAVGLGLPNPMTRETTGVGSGVPRASAPCPRAAVPLSNSGEATT